MHKYYLFNKPAGCITACRDERHKTVMDYFPEDMRGSFFPIGRLDKDTEGMLIVTDDGPLFYELMLPGHKVNKTYFFWALGTISEEKIKELEEGVAIYNDKSIVTSKARFSLLEVKTLSDIKDLLSYEDGKLTRRKGALPVFSGLLTITEGKKHQVKRMIKYAGSRILYLKRVAIGSLRLDETLRVGEYRELSDEELALLRGE